MTTAEPPTTPVTPTTLSTPAWLLDGLGSHRGTLHLAASRLSFVSRDGRHDVAWPADALRAAFPWRLLGAGMVLTAAGRRSRLCFAHPDALADPPGDRGHAAAGRDAVTAWRRLLARRPDRGGPG